MRSWAGLLLEIKGANDPLPMRNLRSGKIAMRVPTWPGQNENGNWIERCHLLRPTGATRMDVMALDATHWEVIDIATCQGLWEAEVAEAEASLHVDTISMATGLLLPVWNRLPDSDVKVWRIDDGSDTSILGRIVPSYAFDALEKEFGLEGNTRLSAAEMIVGARAGEGVDIPGLKPARLVQVFVNSSRRLEIRDFPPQDRTWLKAAGAFSEIIQFKTRLFLPADRAHDILEVIMAARA